MNPIEKLYERLLANFPTVEIELTPPANADGVWWLELNQDGSRTTVEWKSSRGFGISDTDSVGYGEGPDERYDTLEDTENRLKLLLGTADRPAPSFCYLMKRIRESQGLTQNDLASRLNVTQATISGIESRGDLRVGTLERLVNALSGRLEIYAVFKSARYRLAFPSSSSKRSKKDSASVSCFRQSIRPNAFLCLERTGAMPSAVRSVTRIKQDQSIMAL